MDEGMPEVDVLDVDVTLNSATEELTHSDLQKCSDQLYRCCRSVWLLITGNGKCHQLPALDLLEATVYITVFFKS
jgi:hypothetical protein